MSTPDGADIELPRYPGPAAPRAGGPAVVVRGLWKKFGTKEAVAGIDLEVAAGFAGWPRRAERGVQDHVAVDDDRAAAAGQRPDPDQRH